MSYSPPFLLVFSPPVHQSYSRNLTIFLILMFILYMRVRRYTLTVDDRREMGGDEASHTYIHIYIHQLTLYETR